MSERSNPFEPPKAEWRRAPRVRGAIEIVNATRGRRFVNSLVDGACQAVLVTLFVPNGVFTALLITLAYYVVFEAALGKTPAKWITRTRVVRTDGRRPSFRQVVGRSLARLVPFEPLSFLHSPRGWHDRWSKTRVVHEWEAPLRHRRH